MSFSRAVTLALVFAGLLAACGRTTPTEPVTRTAPNPRTDDGPGMMGGGGMPLNHP
jgi:hypothetical protein